jgi:hypothetical protein
MNNVFVYCEIEDGQVAEVSLELLTKGRSLASELNCETGGHCNRAPVGCRCRAGYPLWSGYLIPGRRQKAVSLPDPSSYFNCCKAF